MAVITTEPVPLTYRNGGNAALLALVPDGPGRALDCGCGAGDNARLLRAAGWRVTGVTHDAAEAAAVGDACDEVHLADLAAGLPFLAPASCDLVVLSHVLEHLADPSALLRETTRVLAPSGLVAVALPNVLHYRQRAALLRGRFEYTETGPLDRTHLRFYTVSGARRMLRQNGFAVLSETPDGELPWWRLRAAVTPAARERIDRWAVRRWPDLLAWQGVYLCAPKGTQTRQ